MARRWVCASALVLAGVLALAGSASAQRDDESIFGEDFAALDECAGTGLGAVLDVQAERVRDVESEQDVELDEDTTLLGIALANNDLGDVSFEDLAQADQRRVTESTLTRDVGVDRDDVFTALVLGLGDEGLSEDELAACAFGVDAEATEVLERDRDIELDEDDVLLGIALANNGADVDFDDLRSGDVSERREVSLDRDVDVDRDDALLLLALGGGS